MLKMYMILFTADPNIELRSKMGRQSMLFTCSGTSQLVNGKMLQILEPNV